MGADVGNKTLDYSIQSEKCGGEVKKIENPLTLEGQKKYVKSESNKFNTSSETNKEASKYYAEIMASQKFKLPNALDFEHYAINSKIEVKKAKNKITFKEKIESLNDLSALKYIDLDDISKELKKNIKGNFTIPSVSGLLADLKNGLYGKAADKLWDIVKKIIPWSKPIQAFDIGLDTISGLIFIGQGKRSNIGHKSPSAVPKTESSKSIETKSTKPTAYLNKDGDLKVKYYDKKSKKTKYFKLGEYKGNVSIPLTLIPNTYIRKKMTTIKVIKNCNNFIDYLKIREKKVVSRGKKRIYKNEEDLSFGKVLKLEGDTSFHYAYSLGNKQFIYGNNLDGYKITTYEKMLTMYNYSKMKKHYIVNDN